MNGKKPLSLETINLELKGETKEAILEEMVDLLMASGKIKDRAAVLTAIKDREARMSTGMQNGIAIPHGKSSQVECLVAAVGIKKSGVSFGSLDGQPSRIIVMTVSPDNRTGPHIQFLAEISRPLNDPAVREAILNAVTKGQVLQALGQ